MVGLNLTLRKVQWRTVGAAPRVTLTQFTAWRHWKEPAHSGRPWFQRLRQRLSLKIIVNEKSLTILQGVITPSYFSGTWCCSHNFRVLGPIKVNPTPFWGELGVIKVKSAKMTFCMNRKISLKTEILHLKSVKENPKFSNLMFKQGSAHADSWIPGDPGNRPDPLDYRKLRDPRVSGYRVGDPKWESALNSTTGDPGEPGAGLRFRWGDSGGTGI